MSKVDLIVVGGGEYARTVIEAAQAQGHWNIVGFVDPQPCEETQTRLGIPHLGDDTALLKWNSPSLIMGVGAVKVSDIRKTIVRSIGNDRWITVVHPFAWVSPTAILDRGVVVFAGSAICSGAHIREHSIINLGAKIDHDVTVGKFVHVAPQAALGGGSTVEDDCYIGMAAAVRDHVTVSAKTLVGMGAIVTKQFDQGQTLVGIPAKPQ